MVASVRITMLGESQADSICALARLQHISRTSLPEVGVLGLIFLLSLPLLNPWVRGDVAAATPLSVPRSSSRGSIFTQDYRYANPSRSFHRCSSHCCWKSELMVLFFWFLPTTLFTLTVPSLMAIPR